MTAFKGTVTAISQKQSGTSKSNKAWSKIDVTMVYDNSKPEWPKSIVFSVMNDNIEKMGFVVGREYEVEVDFSTREYNGKAYMSASCWKATPTQQPSAQPTEQQGWQSAYPPAQPKAQTVIDNNAAGDLPF